MKKELRLKKELRFIGYDTKKTADEFEVSIQTINNWCSGRTLIPAKAIRKFINMGISIETLEKPSELI